MEQRDIFRQTNAFAMQYGALFGIQWIIGFTCFILCLQHPTLQAAYLVILFAVPFIGWYLVKTFRDRVTEGFISFRRAFLFSLMTYFYATVLLAITAYIYFEFIDHGQFFAAYLEYLERPEVKQILNTPDMQLQMQTLFPENGLKGAVEMLQGLSSTVIVANIIDINIFMGLILSLLTALFVKRNKRLV